VLSLLNAHCLLQTPLLSLLVFRTDNETALPLLLLNTSYSLPDNITASNISVEVQYHSSSELVIIWSFGQLYNVPDDLIDDNDLVEIVHTLVVASNASSAVIPIFNSVSNVDTNETVIAELIYVHIVEPRLIAVQDIKVKMNDLIVITCSILGLCNI